MEELKKRYNELLDNYKKGEELLKSNPDNEEIKGKLLMLSSKMEKVINEIGTCTPEELANGFEIKETQIAIAPKKSENLVTSFEDKWNIASKMAKSSLFPVEFQNKPENVVIALGMSEKMGLDLFTVAQNLHIIKGKLSWSGSFCKTLIEQSGQYKDLDLVYVGEEGKDSYGCYLEATRVRDGKRIKGNTVTVKLAKDEEWWSKNPKWRNMTAQMLGYRATAFFARLYTPEVLNGVMTAEENTDISEEKEQPIDLL